MSLRHVFVAAVLAASMLAVAALGTVNAQTLDVAIGLGVQSAAPVPAGAPVVAPSGLSGRFTVAVRGVRVTGTTVGAALGYSRGAMPGAWSRAGRQYATSAGQLDLSLSANETFGPVGNVIFELSGALRTDALAHGAVTVRGTIGPIAARVSLLAFGADAALFDSLAVGSDDRPTLGRAGAGAQLGVTARFGRTVILDVEPELYLTSAGFAGRLEARLRRLRTFGDNELRVYLHGASLSGAAPSEGGWHAAVGAGVLLPRGRAPDVELLAFIGAHAGRVMPGARVAWSEALGGGVRLDAAGSFEPYRVDVHPLRVTFGFEFPVTAGSSLRFDAVTAALDRSRPAAFALRSMYSVPFSLR